MAVITSFVHHLHTLGSVKKSSKILKLLHHSVITPVLAVPDHLPEVVIMRLLNQAVCLVHFNLLPQSMEVSIVDIGQIISKYYDSAKGLSVKSVSESVRNGKWDKQFHFLF